MMEAVRNLDVSIAPSELVALYLCRVGKVSHAIEAFGFDVATELVVFAAKQLERAAADIGQIFHLGGADFAVLAHSEHLDEVAACERLLACETEPFQHGGASLHLKLRIGYAVFPRDAVNAEELSRFAARALTEAIASRTQRAIRFKPAMVLAAINIESIEDTIRHALDRDWLEAYFQPRVDAMTGRVTGFEALARWRSLVLKEHDTLELIKIAERSMLTTDIDTRMLRLSLEWVATLTRSGADITVAVNHSARSLQRPDFASRLAEMLSELAVAPARLQLELTETVLIEDDAVIAENLRALHRQGIAILLDDFGSGYSSLRYLHELPIATVKIDKSFVSGLPAEGGSRLIVESTVQLCQRLGKHTVAEGVETDEQWEYLRSVGCEEVQGYRIARPADAETMRDLVLHHLHAHSGAVVLADRLPESAAAGNSVNQA